MPVADRTSGLTPSSLLDPAEQLVDRVKRGRTYEDRVKGEHMLFALTPQVPLSADPAGGHSKKLRDISVAVEDRSDHRRAVHFFNGLGPPKRSAHIGWYWMGWCGCLTDAFERLLCRLGRSIVADENSVVLFQHGEIAMA